SFKTGTSSALPSSTADVAVTVAQLFGLHLPEADGRPLLEGLAKGGLDPAGGSIERATITPAEEATGVQVSAADDPRGQKAPDPVLSRYSVEVTTSSIVVGGKRFTYFDSARAIRR